MEASAIGGRNEAVNFEQNKIAFTAKKTGRSILLPLVQPLIDYLSALPSE